MSVGYKLWCQGALLLRFIVLWTGIAKSKNTDSWITLFSLVDQLKLTEEELARTRSDWEAFEGEAADTAMQLDLHKHKSDMYKEQLSDALKQIQELEDEIYENNNAADDATSVSSLPPKQLFPWCLFILTAPHVMIVSNTFYANPTCAK